MQRANKGVRNEWHCRMAPNELRRMAGEQVGAGLMAGDRQ